MSLFTKIKQGWQARHRRRLAAKLQRMIAAAADENDGALSLRCDIILHGDMFTCGENVTRKTIYANEGICTDGNLDARVMIARTQLVAAEILAEGGCGHPRQDSLNGRRLHAWPGRQPRRRNGLCIHSGLGDSAEKKDRGQPVRAPAAKSRRETMW